MLDSTDRRGSLRSSTSSATSVEKEEEKLQKIVESLPAEKDLPENDEEDVSFKFHEQMKEIKRMLLDVNASRGIRPSESDSSIALSAIEYLRLLGNSTPPSSSHILQPLIEVLMGYSQVLYQNANKNIAANLNSNNENENEDINNTTSDEDIGSDDDDDDDEKVQWRSIANSRDVAGSRFRGDCRTILPTLQSYFAFILLKYPDCFDVSGTLLENACRNMVISFAAMIFNDSNKISSDDMIHFSLCLEAFSFIVVASHRSLESLLDLTKLQGKSKYKKHIAVSIVRYCILICRVFHVYQSQICGNPLFVRLTKRMLTTVRKLMFSIRLSIQQSHPDVGEVLNFEDDEVAEIQKSILGSSSNMCPLYTSPIPYLESQRDFLVRFAKVLKCTEGLCKMPAAEEEETVVDSLVAAVEDVLLSPPATPEITDLDPETLHPNVTTRKREKPIGKSSTIEVEVLDLSALSSSSNSTLRSDTVGSQSSIISIRTRQSTISDYFSAESTPRSGPNTPSRSSATSENECARRLGTLDISGSKAPRSPLKTVRNANDSKKLPNPKRPRRSKNTASTSSGTQLTLRQCIDSKTGKPVAVYVEEE